MTEVTFQIRYTCRDCDVAGREVEVPEREPGEDIVSWVRAVAAIVSKDHSSVRPECQADTFAMTIPMPRGDQIGRAQRH